MVKFWSNVSGSLEISALIELLIEKGSISNEELVVKIKKLRVKIQGRQVFI